MTTQPVILTVDQAAELLQFEPATIRRLAARGEIPARKIAGAWRFHREQLEAFIKQGSLPARAPSWASDDHDYATPSSLHAPEIATAIAKFERLEQHDKRKIRR